MFLGLLYGKKRAEKTFQPKFPVGGLDRSIDALGTNGSLRDGRGIRLMLDSAVPCKQLDLSIAGDSKQSKIMQIVL